MREREHPRWVCRAPREGGGLCAAANPPEYEFCAHCHIGARDGDYGNLSEMPRDEERC